jgi:hypothetical protein
MRWVASLGAATVFLGWAFAGGISPPLSIWTDVIDNVDPEVAWGPVHDAFLATWISKQDDFTWDVWARPVERDGTLLGAFNVDTSAGERLSNPSIASGGGQDHFCIAFEREYSDTDIDIWAHRVNWNGPGTIGRIIIDGSVLQQINPAVAYNSRDDEYLVVYETETPIGRDIAAVRVTASTGAVTAPVTLASSTGGDGRTDPDVIFDPGNNRYLVVYAYFKGTGGYGAVLSKTASPDLSSLQPEQQIADTWYRARQPNIAVGPGEVLVTWDLFDPYKTSIYGRRAALDGTPLGPAYGFRIDKGYDSWANSLDKQYPDAAFIGHGMYLVVWESILTTDRGITGDGAIKACLVAVGEDAPKDPIFDLHPDHVQHRNPALANADDEILVVVEGGDTVGPGDTEIDGYLLSPVVFADGLESGDCGAWSSVVGEVP